MQNNSGLIRVLPMCLSWMHTPQHYNEFGEVSQLQNFCPDNYSNPYYNHYMEQQEKTQPFRKCCEKVDKFFVFFQPQHISGTGSEFIIFDDNTLFVSGVMHVAFIVFKKCSSNGRPTISHLKFTTVEFESCATSIRDGLYSCAMLTIVMSLRRSFSS